MLEVYRDCSLENGPCPSELTNAGLPLCVFQPGAHVVFLHTEGVLKVLPHTVLVVIEFVGVRDSDLGWLMLIQLVLD